MNTKLIMVRHAKVIYTEDDKSRELSEEGKIQRKDVLEALKRENVDIIYSSPYKRAIDTIKLYADFRNMDINIVDDLRERKVSDVFIDDFMSFSINQWKDFNYKLNGGESLNEVKDRGIKVIENILNKHKGKDIVVGTHGTFLSVLLNHYDDKFNYEDWKALKMPAIFIITFDDKLNVIDIEETALEGKCVKSV
ncbi:histidine phosphatase family protein [Senegalia massiliensis]|uniref:Histidine phosphatase family protein n=1 Tax=Senegalia massiliensis TaxID=1720316 RepID=A0A845QXI8_9CLOT|nr:histidine phosphatase family protein [Senegalia massiliensis]NBI06216.1 histidine phosphatase family protein [Senegalia massiliensis]